VVGLAGDRLTASTREAMATHVTQMRRHMWRDLPYTVSSMRNNHSLGDALGLLLADDMTGRNHSRVRHGVAELMWRGQFRRQINPDGSMIEDSLSYHRFVLEMFIVKYLLGDRSAILREAIANSSQYLAHLGALKGPLPQYGDWDEGRVLATSGDPLDVGNSVALGLVIAGKGEDPEWRERFDLLDWYAPRPSVDLRINIGSVQRAKKVGDFVTAKRGDWQVWLKCGSGPSHGHADLGHVSARYRHEWVLVDPGTGTYNGPLEVRNGFRVSSAHNVLRSSGLEQIEPHRAFRWMSTPTGRAGRVLETPAATILWGAHDAYVVSSLNP
jgi:Heparinase II/III-like protein.